MLAVRVLVPLLTVLVSGWATYQFMGAVGPDVQGGGDGPAPVTGPIPASDERSLIRPARFQAVLDAMREDFGPEARVVSLRLEGARADVEVVRRGTSTTAQYNSDAEMTFGSTRPDTSPGDAYIALSRIDARAPARMMRGVARRAEASLDDLNYMVLSPSTLGERPEWLAFLQSGAGPYRARLDGSDVQSPPS